MFMTVAEFRSRTGFSPSSSDRVSGNTELKLIDEGLENFHMAVAMGNTSSASSITASILDSCCLFLSIYSVAPEVSHRVPPCLRRLMDQGSIYLNAHNPELASVFARRLEGLTPQRSPLSSPREEIMPTTAPRSLAPVPIRVPRYIHEWNDAHGVSLTGKFSIKHVRKLQLIIFYDMTTDTRVPPNLRIAWQNAMVPIWLQYRRDNKQFWQKALGFEPWDILAHSLLLGGEHEDRQKIQSPFEVMQGLGFRLMTCFDLQLGEDLFQSLSNHRPPFCIVRLKSNEREHILGIILLPNTEFLVFSPESGEFHARDIVAARATWGLLADNVLPPVRSNLQISLFHPETHIRK